MSSNTRQDTGRSRLGVHVGNALMTAANKYNSLELTLAEIVQNAIDAGAKHIFMGIDYSRRSAIFLDDGLGVTEDAFHEALANVYESRKSKKKFGRFGVGSLSPLNKCSHFEFSSRALGATEVHKWKFVQAEIASQRADIDIPHDVLRDLPAIPQAFRKYTNSLGITWNTLIQMHRVIEKQTVSNVDPDSLEDLIRTKFGSYLHNQSISIHFVMIDKQGHHEVRDIKPHIYTGEALPPFIYDEGTAAGRVVMELYKAPKRSGKRKGLVSVSELEVPYGVSWQNFRMQAMGLGWYTDSPAMAVLGSGYFEGTIKAQNVELTIERTKFDNGPALLDLYVALDTWYREVGRSHYEDEQEKSRDDRYNQLALQAMEIVHDCCQQPEFELLVAQLRETVRLGRVGKGHGTEGKKIVGEDERGSIRTGQGGVGVARTPSESPTNAGRGVGETRDGDLPTGVIGRGRKPRALVKDDSIGLWIEIADFEFSNRLWEFDVDTGRVQFNSRNSAWAQLDGLGSKRRTSRNDRQIINLQKWVILEILVLLRQPIDEFEERRRFVDEKLRPLILMDFFDQAI